MNNNMTTSNNGGITTMKKRPLPPPPPKLRLTNCQWIDCVTNNTIATGSGTSSSNLQASQIRYQARNVCWNASGSLLAVGCSDSMIRFWNPMSISLDATTTTNIPCKDVGSINTTTSSSSTGNINTTTNNHNLPVIAATFHPTSDPILCSMTAGSGTLRLWDVRSSSSSTANITNTNNNITTPTTTITSSALSHCTIMTSSSSSSSSSSLLPIVVAVEWNPIQTHMISCTTHDGTVSIYDTRKFTNHTTTTSTTSTAVVSSSTTTTTNHHNDDSALVQKIQFPYNDRIESCIFDPMNGEYIMAGITNRGSSHPNPNTNKNPTISSSSSNISSSSSSGGMGYIKACQWDTIQSNNNKTQHEESQQWYAYPAHAGPIYTIASSHNHHHQNQQHRRTSNGGDKGPTTTTTTNGSNGSYRSPKIATGGSDAVVGIWDVSTMTCTSTISSRTKFIRALAFSYPKNDKSDPLLLAIATEEDVIELIDCSSNHCNSIGCANLSNTSSIGRRSMMMSNPGIMAGAEDICFHPTIPNLLACARTTDVATPSGMSSVTLLKFTISSSSM